MRLSAILLAAGKGVRLRRRASKPLVKIGSRPLISYSLAVLNRHPAIKEIVVVVNRGNRGRISALIKRQKARKVSAIVLGGARRQDSVLNGMTGVDERSDFVLIHDSARPFIDAGMVSRVIDSGRKAGASITGLPLSFTVKSVKKNGLVERTLDRRQLWEIQTPQAFNRKLLLSAYRKYGSSDVTDDAALIEKMGKNVAVVSGSPLNIKITAPRDLVLAEAIASKKK